MEALDKKNLYHDVGGCGYCGANATSGTGVQDPISSLTPFPVPVHYGTTACMYYTKP